MKDLAIGFIHGSTWDPFFGLSLVRVARELDIGKWISVPCGAMIDAGRNKVVEAFLASDKDYLLMVDTDMTFSPSMVASLYDKRSPDYILSGLCKAEDGSFVPKVQREVDGATRFFVIEPNPEKPLVEVTLCGAAFTLVHRSVYEKVAAEYGHVSRKWYAFTERFSNAGEDAEFCARAAEVGFKTVVDCTVTPGHRKTKTIGGDTIPE